MKPMNITITISRQLLTETYTLEDLGLNPASTADEVANAIARAEDNLLEWFCDDVEITHTHTSTN